MIRRCAALRSPRFRSFRNATIAAISAKPVPKPCHTPPRVRDGSLSEWRGFLEEDWALNGQAAAGSRTDASRRMRTGRSPTGTMWISRTARHAPTIRARGMEGLPLLAPDMDSPVRRYAGAAGTDSQTRSLRRHDRQCRCPGAMSCGRYKQGRPQTGVLGDRTPVRHRTPRSQRCQSHTCGSVDAASHWPGNPVFGRPIFTTYHAETIGFLQPACSVLPAHEYR